MNKKTVYQGHLVFNMHNMVIFSRRVLHAGATVTVSYLSLTFLIVCCSKLANKAGNESRVLKLVSSVG